MLLNIVSHLGTLSILGFLNAAEITGQDTFLNIIEHKYSEEKLESISRMAAQIQSCLDSGISPARISVIADVDGTLTTQANPCDYKSEDSVIPRGASVEFIKWLLDLKINIIFASAWTLTSLNDPLLGFKQTLERLEKLGLQQSGVPIEEERSYGDETFSVMSCGRAISVRREVLNVGSLSVPSESSVTFGFGSPKQVLGFSPINRSSPDLSASFSQITLQPACNVPTLPHSPLLARVSSSGGKDIYYRQKSHSLLCYDKDIAAQTEILFFVDDSSGNINIFITDFKKIQQQFYPNIKKLYVYELNGRVPISENWENILRDLRT